MGRGFAVYPATKNCIRKVGRANARGKGAAAAICPPKFPVGVFATEFTREFRHPLLGIGGKCNAQSARFCAPSTRRVRRRPDGRISILHRRELFLGSARALGSALPKFPRGMTGDLARFPAFVRISRRSRYDAAVSIFDRETDIYFFSSLQFAAPDIYRIYTAASSRHRAYASCNVSWASFEEAKKRRSTSYSINFAVYILASWKRQKNRDSLNRLQKSIFVQSFKKLLTNYRNNF